MAPGGLPKSSQHRPKMAPKSLPGAPRERKNKECNMKSFFDPPGGLPNRTRRPPEPKKIHGELPGGLRENFPASFHAPKGLRRPIWAPFWPPWGLLFCFLSFGAKPRNLKKHCFNRFSKIFKGSGTSRGSFLEPKALPKTAQTTRPTFRAQK